MLRFPVQYSLPAGFYTFLRAGLAGLAPPQGLTPRAKRVIENAVGESGRTGGGYVGTEHLLLGILRENANQGEPLVGKNSDAGQAFYNICKRLEGKEVPFRDFGKSVTIWTRFSGLFKKNLQEERA